MRWFFALGMLAGCAGPDPIAFFGGGSGGYGIGSSRPSLEGITHGEAVAIYDGSLFLFYCSGWYGNYGGPRLASSYFDVLEGEIGEDGRIEFPPLRSCTVFGDRVECTSLGGAVRTHVALEEPIEWELSNALLRAPGVERAHTFEEEPRWD